MAKIPTKRSMYRLHSINRNKKLFPIIVLLLAGLCFFVGGKLLYDRHRALRSRPLPPAEQVVSQDTDSPSEAPVDENEAVTYTVPSNQPRSISINSIGAKGLIQKVGTTTENKIAVPTNVHIAGWFVGSAYPGEIGLSIIDGHVSGRYSDGIFNNLDKVQINDEVVIEYGDKSLKRFEVVDKTIVPEEKASEALFDKREGIKQQLNLITCGGRFNKTTNTYESRVVVIARYLE